MKKITAMLLALIMVFSMFALTACGDDAGSANTDAGSSNTGSGGNVGTPSTDAGSSNTDAGTPDAGGASDLGPIKIGHICDLTGTDALTGAEAKNAMDFAVKYIGEICGREIQVIHKDSQSVSDAAADAARALIEEDEVEVIFGPTLIGHKGAVAAVASSMEVPVIFYNPTPAGMIANNNWVLGASGSTPQMPTVMADYVFNDLGYDTVYTLTKDDSGGKSYMEPFTANFTAMGGKVLDQEWVPNDVTDYAPYMMTMTDESADCLIAWTSGSAAMAMWNCWYDLGLHEKLPVVAIMHGAFTDSFICDALSGTNPALVEKIKGTIAPMTWAYNIESEENEAFVEAWKAEFGEFPIGNNLPGAAVQVLLLLKAAVESLDGVTDDSAALRDALLAADITGPEGRTAFEAGSNMAIKDVYVVKVVQLEDGNYNYEMVKEYSDVPVAGLTVG